jgi:hypothetical protein
MPNHCENDLSIEGAPEDVAAFMQAVKGDDGEPFDCDKIIPYPEPFRSMDAKRVQWRKDNPDKGPWYPEKDGFNSGGYEWCRDNWGTKWGAYEGVAYMRGNTQMISFQSAWSPPIPVMVAMAAKFPTLRFELNYFEQGAGYCGTWAHRPAEDGDPARITESRGEYAGLRGG